MKKISIARSSSLPNKLGSFAYRVLTPITPEMGLSGVYPTTDGVSLIYSRVRVGELNKPFTCDCRINTVEGKKYINLIDASAEAAGQFGQMFSQATQAGFAHNPTFAQAFINYSTGQTGNQAAIAAPAPTATPAVQAEPTVVVEEPAQQEQPAAAEVVA